MKKSLRLLIIGCIGVSISLYADTLKSKTLQYDFISDDEDIGDVTQTYVIDEKEVFLITKSHLYYSSWYDALDLEEVSLEHYNKESKLLSSRYYLMDYNEKSLYFSGFQKNSNSYLVQVLMKEEVSDTDERLYKEFVQNVSKSKDLSEVETLSIKMDELATKTIALDSFTITENMMAFSIKKLVSSQKIKELLLAEVEIDDITIRDLGLEMMSIKSEKLLTHHYRIHKETKEAVEIWIADEDSDIPYVVRLITSDDFGKHELLLHVK